MTVAGVDDSNSDDDGMFVYEFVLNVVILSVNFRCGSHQSILIHGCYYPYHCRPSMNRLFSPATVHLISVLNAESVVDNNVGPTLVQWFVVIAVVR